MEAIRKLQAQIRDANRVLPHKVEFRTQLIEQLKAAGIRGSTSVPDKSSKDGDIEALTKL